MSLKADRAESFHFLLIAQQIVLDVQNHKRFIVFSKNSTDND